MDESAVRIEGLRKSYGFTEALQGTSFTVAPGEIFGLVGPNGAGKSTTLRILATLLTYDAGTVEVLGHDVGREPETVRQLIRYLPDEAGAYDDLTGRGYLTFLAGFFADDPAPLVEKAVTTAALGDRIDSRAGEYSRGMTRKLLLASTLMTEPRLAILDEPTSGLDVRNAREVRDVIRAYPRGERSVLLSSHNMLEVAYLCHRVAFIDEGTIVAVGTPDELLARFKAENLEDAFLEALP